MLRDVLVASIYRGQFPPALIGLVMIAIVLKMPAEDLSRVVLHFFDSLGRHELLGYLLASLCTMGWFAHARLQRRWVGEERRRLSDERAALKAMILGARSGSEEAHS
jgi:hypothetical protein